MKIGISYHQSVSVRLSVCPPLITFEPLGNFHEIWYEGNAIQGDLDAVIFNPIPRHVLPIRHYMHCA
jgi:hypothetical protein